MTNSLIVPEVVYMILLLVSWITAMFSGIAFVYGIFMKKAKNTILPWCAVCRGLLRPSLRSGRPFPGKGSASEPAHAAVYRFYRIVL